MKALIEGAKLKAADVEPCRFRQARSLGMSTLGLAGPPLKAESCRLRGGRFTSGDHFRGKYDVESLQSRRQIEP